MKALFNAAAFLPEAQKAARIVEKNPIVPIWKNLLLDFTTPTPIISSANASERIDLRSNCDFKLTGTGMICVDAIQFVQLLSLIGDQVCTLNYDKDTYKVSVKTATGKYSLVGENPEDFSDIPQINANAGVFTVDISAALLKKAVEQTYFACSTETFRPEMNYILVQLGEKLVSAATNGFLLSEFKTDFDSQKAHFLFSPKYRWVIDAFGTDDLTLLVGDSWNQITGGNLSYFFLSPSERFPDYEPYFNSLKFSGKLCINKSELSSSLSQIAFASPMDKPQFGFKFSDGKITLSCSNREKDSDSEEILYPVSNDEFADFTDSTIGMNIINVKDFCKVCESDTVIFSLADNKLGMLMMSEGGQSRVFTTFFKER
ncbi:MAG: hypothetical protein ACRCVT_10155 [Leadbetterella sp.]